MPFHDPTQQAEGKAARWVNEPVHERHPDLKRHTKRPFNAEPSNLALQSMYTPKGQHYRRTHAPVPLVDDEQYRLNVEVEDAPSFSRRVSLKEIYSFPLREVSVTMMCTGNRRGEYNQFGQTAGLPWKNGSISTAKWKGCALRDVLEDAGISTAVCKAKGLRFVTFWGLEDYHVSIPLEKAMAADGDVLLAFIMNGDRILRDHGAPLRAVVPGYVGARSVKWLDRIVVMRDPVEGMHQTGIAYKQLPPNQKSLKGLDQEMIRGLPPIDIIPVTSAVTKPDAESQVVRGEELECSGYAYSGGGRAVVRVDVSIDGGKTWDQATLKRAVREDGKEQSVRSNSAWAWTQWRYRVKVPLQMEELQVCCKAVDDQYNQQPHSVEPIWNVRGILNTSWGRSTVQTLSPLKPKL